MGPCLSAPAPRSPSRFVKLVEHDSRGPSSKHATAAASYASTTAMSSPDLSIVPPAERKSVSVKDPQQLAMEPQQEAAKRSSAQADATRTDRLFSCPDHQRHSEEDLARRLVSLFTLDTDDTELVSSDPLMHKFDARRLPKYPLDEYIKRLVHYLTNVAFTDRRLGHDVDVHSDLAVRYLITARMLIRRVQEKKGLVLSPLNVHRFVIAAVLLASKILDDIEIGIAFFSLLGGLAGDELVMLESTMLDLLHYDLSVDQQTFKAIYADVLGTTMRLMSVDLEDCFVVEE